MNQKLKRQNLNLDDLDFIDLKLDDLDSVVGGATAQWWQEYFIWEPPNKDPDSIYCENAGWFDWLNNCF